MPQVAALFLPPRRVNGKKTSVRKNASNKSIDNKMGGTHERKEKKNKGTAYLLRAF